jgi:hypothetical protein
MRELGLTHIWPDQLDNSLVLPVVNEIARYMSVRD